MARPSRYPDEFRRDAVQMALASRTSWAAVARRLGANKTTLRKPGARWSSVRRRSLIIQQVPSRAAVRRSVVVYCAFCW
jgi:transposase-like protein